MSCPTCGHVPSNRRDVVQLEVPVAMLVSMVHALAIGRNTEMMCSSPQAADEMEIMRKAIFAQLGASHIHFRERDWTKLMLGAWKGLGAEASVVEAPNSWRKYRVQVEMDGKLFFSTEAVTQEEATAIQQSLMADIDRVTPMI